MIANRLFQIVYLLLEYGRLTAEELAEKLEVSVRTVYRDVEALSAAGIPVFTTQGKGGGVALMEGYVLDRAAFTEEEQRLLLTALQSLPGQEGEKVLSKLSALFSRREDDWLQINLSRWGASGWDREKFRLLKRAILERRAVRFTYASSRGGVQPRQALPARLVYKGQGWYLQAWDTEKEDYRTFRLTRILSLEVTGELFRRRLEPPDIDFSGEIPPLFRVEARLRFDSHLAYRVYDEFDESCVERLEDGSLLVEAVFPEDQWLYGYLLSFGAGVEVLAPDALRQRLAAMAGEICRVHTEPDTPCQVCCDTIEPSNQKEALQMDYANMKFCQSCGMPMEGMEYGTEADGTPSPDYCAYCYKDGKFSGEMTMEEMIDFCTPFMVQNHPDMTAEQAKSQMRQFFPLLKRWK